jgi:polyisoprenoid-binding protein YceI
MRRTQLLSSPFAPMFVTTVALVGSTVRWYVQGSGNVFTAFAKRFYVPDRDIGWRVTARHPIWLGLDACAAIVAIALALTLAGTLIRHRERAQRKGARVARIVTWAFAAIAACVPAAAFASGRAPPGAREMLPPTAAVLIEDGIEGSLDAPEGTYVVVRHDGTAVTAHLSAGGEAFDARFGDITGTWQGSPRDLRQPMRVELGVAARSVDTGVGERSKHAREGYLHADRFPRITVTLDRVAAVRANGPNAVAFRAPGTVSLMGKTHSIEVTGTVAKLDSAALQRLGLDREVLFVRAGFSLPIRETALVLKAHDFDGDRIPIQVSLVLRHTDG